MTGSLCSALVLRLSAVSPTFYSSALSTTITLSGSALTEDMNWGMGQRCRPIRTSTAKFWLYNRTSVVFFKHDLHKLPQYRIPRYTKFLTHWAAHWELCHPIFSQVALATELGKQCLGCGGTEYRACQKPRHATSSPSRHFPLSNLALEWER